METDAAELVPGDIIVLQAGDRVPADARLLDSKQLETDQSILTGESTPTLKNTATLLEASGNITLESIGDFAGAGVDACSVGRLTHSAPAMDLALDMELQA